MGSFSNPGASPSSPSSAALLDFEEPRKATSAPLITAIILILLSAAIWLLDFQAVYPFTYNYFNVAGYVLTPFLVFMCVAWDAASQRAGRRSPWFDIRPGYSKALRILAVLALAIAVPHILDMGRSVGEWVVQTGLFL